MNYELAKKLMDAGFPAGGDGRSLCVAGLGAFDGACGLTHKCDKTRIYHPTLSELIEACGDGDILLGKQDGIWCAYDNWFLPEAVSNTITRSETPEEAVSLLYLYLKRNEK